MRVDISTMDIKSSLRVRDVDQKLETIEILNSPGVPIASVETPRALRSAATAAAKAGEAAPAEGEAEAEAEDAAE